MDLIKRATKLLCSKLIIWDEAAIMHRYCFEAFDRTIRDILFYDGVDNTDKPFGGVSLVLGGDFRQILPVITKRMHTRHTCFIHQLIKVVESL
jgi:hypothetical protein